MVAWRSPSRGITGFLGRTLLEGAVHPLGDELRIPPRLQLVTCDAADLAPVTQLSAAQTRRLFRKHLHMSPRRWLIRERVMLAQKLLLETDESVGEIAERCGFCDVYHFSREFKRNVGASPKTWRHAEGIDGRES
ncbi:MAG: helix-turn-helix transcriptional regulator [Patescibacteria group bacterium]|nr:helix-turn-helix transcriptional regulator [Patescibacteria group bacterium]